LTPSVKYYTTHRSKPNSKALSYWLIQCFAVLCKVLLCVFCFGNIASAQTPTAADTAALSIICEEPAYTFNPLHPHIFVRPAIATVAQLDSVLADEFPFDSLAINGCHELIQVDSNLLADSLMNSSFNYYYGQNTNWGLGQFNPIYNIDFRLDSIDRRLPVLYTPYTGGSAAKVAFIIFPGSGDNTSFQVAHGIGYHSVYCDTKNFLAGKGDVFTYCKPDQDWRGITWNNKRLNNESVNPKFLRNYMDSVGKHIGLHNTIEFLAILKFVQSKYDKVVVLGLSHAGLNLLLSLDEAHADAYLISGGFTSDSSLVQSYLPTQTIYFGSRYNSKFPAQVKDRVIKSRSDFLFSWSSIDGWQENFAKRTQIYFGPNSHLSYFYNYYEHSFPPCYNMDTFITRILAKPRLRMQKVKYYPSADSARVRFRVTGMAPYSYVVVRDNTSLGIVTNNDSVQEFVAQGNGIYNLTNITSGTDSLVNDALLVDIAVDTLRLTYGASLSMRSISRKFAPHRGYVLFDTAAFDLVGQQLFARSMAGGKVTHCIVDALDDTVFATSKYLMIDKATLKVFATNSSSFYGDSIVLANPSYDGFVNGETSNVLLMQPMPSIGPFVNHYSSTGTYAVTVAGGLSDRYQFEYFNAVHAIVKRELLVALSDTTLTYGDPISSIPLRYSGFVNGDSTNVLIIQPVLVTEAGDKPPAGLWWITCDSGVSQNYFFTADTANLTISKRILYVSIADTNSVYGQTAIYPTPSYTGFVYGDNELTLDTYPTANSGTTSSSAVGTYSLFTLGGSAANYSLVHDSSAKHHILPAELVVTLNDTVHVYGDSIVFSQPQITGFVNNQSLADLAALPFVVSQANRQSSVGTYDMLTVGGIATNYTFKQDTAQVFIEQRKLFVNVADTFRLYGDSIAAFSYELLGFTNGDDEADFITPISFASQVNALTAVGVYPYWSQGAIALNYQIINDTASLHIQKRQLDVVANTYAITYGDTLPSVNFTISGFVNNETITVLDSLPSADFGTVLPRNVGQYVIYAHGGLDNNYYYQYTNASLSIAKKELLVAASDTQIVYGNQVILPQLDYFGFAYQDAVDSIDNLPLVTSAGSQGSSVGQYVITVDNGSDDNYYLTYQPALLSIVKASLQIYVVNDSIVYGDIPLPTKLAFTGFVAGEDSSVIDVLPVASHSVTSQTNPGSYVVTLSGGSDDNYNFILHPAILYVAKRELLVSIADTSSVYGSVPVLPALTYTGFTNNQGTSDLDMLPIATTLATQLSDSGIYVITISGGADQQYKFVFGSAILTVVPKPLMITCADTLIEYGSAVSPGRFIFTGFVNGDNAGSLYTQPIASTTASQVSSVGVYPVLISGVTAKNYLPYYAQGLIEIVQRPLIISCPDTFSVYGDSVVLPQIQYSGFIGLDTKDSLTSTAVLSVAANQNSPSGQYLITCSGAQSPNYSILHINANLNILKRSLNASAVDTNSVYGNIPTLPQVIYTGFVNADNADSLDVLATATTNANQFSLPNTYPIICWGAIDNNYVVTHQNAQLLITKRQLDVSVADTMQIYGDTPYCSSINYSNFANLDNADTLIAQPQVNCNFVYNQAVGSYPITVVGGISDRYDFVYHPGLLSILKKPLYVKARDTFSIYGLNPTQFLQLDYSGFIVGEDTSVLQSLPVATMLADSTSVVGNYNITLQGGTSNNYDIVLNSATLEILPRQLQVWASASQSTYGDTPVLQQIQYSGFVNGDSSNSVFAQPPSLQCYACATCNAGLYPISIIPQVAQNYSCTYQGSTHIINQRPLLITISDTACTYGTVPILPKLQASGFANNDSLLSLDVLPVASTLATLTSSVGVYPIQISAGSDLNYQITALQTSSVQVLPAALHVVPQNSQSHYGDAFVLEQPLYFGFVNGDTISSLLSSPVIATLATTSSHTGSYVVYASGASGNNYSITYDSAIHTIVKRSLFVKPVPKSILYGDTAIDIDIEYSNWALSDTIYALDTIPTCYTNTNRTTQVGSYPIFIDAKIDNDYQMIASLDTLTIAKTNVHIIPQALQIVYGDTVPNLVFTASGFQNNEGLTVLTESPSVTVDCNSQPDAGEYQVTVGNQNQISALNYFITYDTAILTVLRKELIVTPMADTGYFGYETTMPWLQYDGFVLGDNADSLICTPSIDFDVTSSAPPGIYVMKVDTCSDRNYRFVPRQGQFIQQASLPALILDTLPQSTSCIFPLVAKYSNTGGHNTVLQQLEWSLLPFNNAQAKVYSKNLADIDGLMGSFNFTTTFECLGDAQFFYVRIKSFNSSGETYSNEVKLDAKRDQPIMLVPISNDVWMLQCADRLLQSDFSIVSLTGQTLLKQKLLSTETIVDLSHLATGTYLVVLDNYVLKDSKSFKILVKR
jgi:hypothetical protein